jgi:hypothetical protein
MDPLQITPPFSYSYQCGSTLLVSYIPVYMYSISLQLISTFVKLIITSSNSFNLPETWLMKWFSIIAWPLQMINKLNGLSRSNPSFVSSVKLINAHQIISNVVNNIILLLSFGLCSPVLSCYITLSICVTLSSWLMLIGRFVFYRHGDPHPHSAMTINSTTLSDLHEAKEEKDDDDLNKSFNFPKGQDPLAGDVFLDRLNHQLRDVNTSLIVCKWPAVITSCFFITVLCWEMTGDNVGWEQSAWVPVVGLGIFLIIWIWDRLLVSRVLDLDQYLSWFISFRPLLSNPNAVLPSHSTELVRSSLRQSNPLPACRCGEGVDI